ncbi:hypothetical protein OPQ81_004588 [Rhizoctonia solani]|nr:hypothetical protein OPQ81_004588 [Rhizoctonia solani]
MSPFTNEPITQLEPQTKAKLRSTQILTSLPQLVSELVQNSLDAGASHIEVGIDPTEWECWVRDDGRGMPSEGMRLLAQGHEQGRYNSSKTYDASHTGAATFGFRGEALASAMELSCLEISSRTSNDPESWSVILKGGEQLYLGPSVRWRREKAGTTVVCRDVFFNVPVRRKSHPSSARTLELTRKELENLALVFPHVSFTLDHTNGLQKTRVVSISKTSSSLGAFRALYGRAIAESAEELNIRSEDLALEGFISLNGSYSRGFQNFYINRHPMVFGEIQRAIEQKFAASGFGRLAQGEDEYDYHLPSRALRSPKKADRKPVYVLNLSISSTQMDNYLEPAKSMVRFQPSFVLSTPGRTVTKVAQTKPFSGPPRKRVRREVLEFNSSVVPIAFTASSNSRGPTHSGTKLPESPSDPQTASDDALTRGDDSGYFEWIDPSTGDPFSIDPQTGNSLPKRRLLDQTQTDRPASGPSALDVSGSSAAVPQWLADALKRNNQFAFPETSVFSTEASSSNTLSGHHGFKPRVHTRALLENNWVSNLTQSSQSTSRNFSRVDLQNSEVIAQVDTKFIACVLRITATSERVLVLVDQHAADERVRVERYLKGLCTGFIRGGVEGFQFEVPIKVLLARREAEILARSDIRDALSRWGLCVGTHVPSVLDERVSMGEQEFSQAEVISVPGVVSKRLGDKRELSDFVKAMIVAIDADGCIHWPLPSLVKIDDSDWVKALRFCPSPLFELVNSRACRGAIMFNDPLDQLQSRHLIKQLGETVFPFQCAHGRPSIAPIIRLDALPPMTPVVDWQAFDQEL